MNATDSGSATLVIPPQTAAGSYFIVAVADGDGVVPESLENNNTRPRTISISVPAGPLSRRACKARRDGESCDRC